MVGDRRIGNELESGTEADRMARVRNNRGALRRKEGRKTENVD